MEEVLRGTRITYMGHATFRVVTAGGEQVIVDPFLVGNPRTPDGLKQVQGCDTLLVTHGHFDHMADAVPLARATGATVVSNVEIYAYLRSMGVENGVPIQKGGAVRVGGITVTATNAFHSSSVETEDGGSIYGGEPMGYIVEFEGGFKLYHAGDTALFGDMALIGDLYGPDGNPYNAPLTIEEQLREAVAFAGITDEPREAYPQIEAAIQEWREYLLGIPVELREDLDRLKEAGGVPGENPPGTPEEEDVALVEEDAEEGAANVEQLLEEYDGQRADYVREAETATEELRDIYQELGCI